MRSVETPLQVTCMPRNGVSLELPRYDKKGEQLRDLILIIFQCCEEEKKILKVMINTLDNIMKEIISQEFHEFIIAHEVRVN